MCTQCLGHFFGKRHSRKKFVHFRDQSEHIGHWATPHHLICNSRDLWAINNLFGKYREYIFGVFCNMFRYYVTILFFLTIKYYLILKYLINSWWIADKKIRHIPFNISFTYLVYNDILFGICPQYRLDLVFGVHSSSCPVQGHTTDYFS